MDDSFGGNNGGYRSKTPNQSQRRGRSAVPRGESDMSPYTPNRRSPSQSPEGHEIVPVHPSHRGSTYQRKPKKKKKKKRAVSAKPKEEYDAYYLAPVDPNSPNFKHRFIEDDELKYNAGGKQGAQNYEIAAYGGAEGSQEGMDDMEQAPEEGSASGGKFGGARGTSPREQEDVQSQQTAQPKKRKRQQSSMATLDSKASFSVVKKEKKDIELPDYDKMAQIDNQLLYTGQAYLQGEDIDPNALLEPHEQDIFPEGDQNQGVGILSYKKVKMHQYKMHPRDRKNKIKFNWWQSDIKFLPCCKSQIKKSQWVTPVAKEIGLGPTLFLMTQKAFTYLFLLFLILSFPLFFFYAKGNGPRGGGTESKQITDYLAMISLGNLGTNQYTCSNINVGKNEKTFMFVCPYGTMREFTEFGLQKYDNQSCTYNAGTYLGENNKWDDLQFDCTYDLGMTEQGKQEIQKRFDDNCYDQSECNIKILYSWFNEDCRNRLEFYAAGSKFDDYADLKNWTYYQRDYRRREPVIFAHALCIADKIYNPFNAKVLPFQKSQFVYFLLIVDFVIVIISIWFINFLEVRYKEYAEIFDQRSVEMRDFTLKFGNLPNDWVYGGKDLMLQCQLWNHIEHHLRASFEQRAQENGNVDLLEKINREKSWEVVDVTFGKNNDIETDMLVRLDVLDRAKKTKIHQVQKAMKEGKEGGVEALNTQIVDDIKAFKELKAEYIHLQEEKLYEMWEINDFNGRSKSDHSNLFAFVTFRSMKGKKRAEKIFMHAAANSKLWSEENEKKFWDEFLTCSTVCSPSSIKWQNISVTFCNRLTRSIIIWLIAIGIIVLAFYLMIIFKDWNDSIKAELSTATCPSEPVPADLALEDWIKPGKQRQGLFHCFCLTTYQKSGGDISSALTAMLAVNPGLDEDPCGDWKFVYENSMYLVILTGAMIGVINGICCFIFEVIVVFEKCINLEDEIKAQFNRIATIQYMNIALVLIFADFSLGYAKEGTGFAILQGNYKDFDTQWYKDIGAKITMAMVSNSIAPFAAKLFEPILVPLLRWALDRCFKKHLRKKTNIEEEIKAMEEKHKADVKAGKASGPPPVATPRSAASGGAPKEEGSPEAEDETQNEGGNDQDEEPAGEGEYDEEEPAPGTTAQPQGGEVYEYEDCEDDEPETQIIFQDDLNELYLNKLVQCFYLYVWFFTNYLIYYTYSGSMPLMYGLGALHFFLAYLSYKFLFIDFYRISYGFDDDIPRYALKLMKYGLLFHLVFNIFMYTNKRILTPAVYDTMIHYRPPGENAGRFFNRRFDILSAKAVLYFFIIIMICYCIYKCIVVPICYIVEVKKERKKAKLEEEAEDELPPEQDEEEAATLKSQIADDFSADFYKELSIKYLRDLYIRSQKEYELFRTMVNAISYDVEKLTDEQAKQFKKNLKLRIQNIEDTIDVHLNLIGGLEKYMDQSYLYKLAVLELNEEKITNCDPKCQRLVDIVQSFHVYEQMEYSKVKLIVNRIDREILELDFVDKDQPVYC